MSDRTGVSTSGQNYNFVDMTGRRIGKLVVVRRMANASGNTQWICRCDCGGKAILQGIYLRSVAKQTDRKYPLGCKKCRPKRPGTVKRRYIRKPEPVSLDDIPLDEGGEL